MELVKALVELGADVNGGGGLLGSTRSTPLHLASGQGHTETVKALVELGADVNVRDILYEQTPLFFASHEGHAETVKALVAARADVLVEFQGGCVASFWRATSAMVSW